MLRVTTNPVRFSLKRSGGARILGQVDVWRATPAGWELVGVTMFADAGSPFEDKPLATQDGVAIDDVPAGHYTARFRLAVSEQLAIGGSFSFEFAVGGQSTYADAGDVNTTPAADDGRRYNELSTLVVQ